MKYIKISYIAALGLSIFSLSELKASGKDSVIVLNYSDDSHNSSGLRSRTHQVSSNTAIYDNAEKNFQLGMKYFKKQKLYEKAYDRFKDAAEFNHAKAQYSLGILYEFGLGTVQSISLASEYYTKAKLNGYYEAAVDTAIKRLSNSK
jgi:TPR repeat protein